MANREQMVARQKALAEFGDLVLRSDDLDKVLQEACRIVGDTLDTDLAKILEIQPEKEELLVKAGVGWRPGIVGQMRLPLGERSSETFAIDLAEPVIMKDIHHEDRFDIPEFLKEHGVLALVNVPIFLPGKRPYGLLQVDSREPREFGPEDIAFLQTYTTILGPVIDRLHKSHSLEQALQTNQQLLQELQHRVKNQFAIVTSLLRMGMRQAQSENARRELAAVKERVETLRLLNEQLYIAGSVDRIAVRPFITELVENLVHLRPPQTGPVRLGFAIEEMEVSPDKAVSLGLILNEFVTNSLKHAFDGRGGAIEIRMERQEDGTMRLRVCDSGKGLPPEPREALPGSGTGMRLIEAFAQQIGAEPVWSAAEPGTALSLEFNSLT
ncbi:GAF domain-containing protein [Rubellimicrobium rubrum]|uniref:histidine kinase n=1 Tax=Rubellimicrobium rubrum TaxID=2585369 RepID=A0A5C4MSW7_9RHOB|nr:histidine kinase dimerization/phosphoacceptor domain -containing protein [Rubellimicrobium rubrum]TNC48432.1 GAF domain-containing protein [Rubellimicrobium rubrum]